MLTGILDSIRRERAEFIHELSFIKEMANEDIIADRVDVAESQYVRETLDDVKLANQMVSEMTVDDKEDEAEINYLLEATGDVTFDEMVMNSKKTNYSKE